MVQLAQPTNEREDRDSPQKLFRQAQWEMLGVERATEAYRAAMEAAKAGGRFHETSAGKRLLREAVPSLEREIAALTIARTGDMITKRGANAPDTKGILAFSGNSERLALIVVSQTVDMLLTPGAKTTVTAIANKIARAMQDELNYRTWLAGDGEGAVSGEEKKARDLLLWRFRDTYPSPSSRQWKAWAAKLHLVFESAWEEADRVHIGTTLLHLLAVTCPDKFVIEAVPRKDGPPVNCILLRPEVEEGISSLESRLELCSPRMLPMTIKPRPWCVN